MCLKNKKIKHGYTLVEVVVVISIMAFLSAIIYSSFDISKAQSRDRQRVSDVSVIQIALEQYFQNYGLYPTDLNSLLGVNISVDENKNNIKFLSEIPKDPITKKSYTENYFPITKIKTVSISSPVSYHCVSYHLWTTLEQKNSFLESKKGFNSETLPSNMYECGEKGSHSVINASSSLNSLVYDVMP